MLTRRFCLVVLAAFFIVFSGSVSCSVEPVATTSSAIDLNTTSLFAEMRINIGNSAMVSGDVAVRQIQAVGMMFPDTPGAQITIGTNAFVGASPAGGPLNTLAAANITVGAGASVGNVDTTTLTNNGGTVGTQSAFPTNLSPTPLTGLAGVVARGSALHYTTPTTLNPGNYGPVTVSNTTLTLNPGNYTFTSITLQHATLTTGAGVGVTVVTNMFTSDPQSTVKPSTALTAKYLTIFTAGDSKFEGATHALVIAHDTVEVGPGAFQGAVSASEINVVNSTTVTFEDGISIAGTAGSQQLSGYYTNQNTFCVTGGRPASETMTLAFVLPFADPTGLAAFVDDRSDPTSPNYRQWFTSVSAFASSSYAPTDAAYAALQTWATAQGLTIVETLPTKMVLTVSGTVAQFEAALFTRLYYRDNGAGGFLAPDREPSLNLTTPLLWIGGLDEWSPLQSADCGKTAPAQGFTSAANGNGLSSIDLRTAYLGTDASCQSFSGTSIDGSGQTVAIFTGTDVIDIATERSGYIAMQPSSTTGAFTGTVSNASLNVDNNNAFVSSVEATMDTEMVMAMAPGANIQLFHDQSGAADVISFGNMMATDGITVVSSSYFPSKSPALQAIQLALASRGISYFVASGDSGDLGDTLNWVDMSYETLVGGTHLVNNGGTLSGGTPAYDNPYYNFEGVWNTGCPGFDTTTNPPSFPHTMSGGGVLNGGCTCFPTSSCCTTGTPIPTFQQNVIMAGINWGTLTTNAGSFEVVDTVQSGNGGSSSWRNFPDIAAAGDNVGIFVDGQGIGGGTSSATPLWAGFAALVNQLAALRGVNSLGYPNPVLYALGLNTPINSVFHDVADGVFNQEPIPNTLGPGATNLGHPAVQGYDLATGWGSFSCPLLQTLSNPVRSNIWIHVENGIDGVNDSSDVTLTINTSIISIPPITIKAANATGWSDGGLVHDIGPIPVGVLRPQDVTSVVLHIDENGGGGDNWDVGGIQVYLTGAHNVAMACLVDLSGNDPDADAGCTTTQSGSAFQPSCQPLNGSLGNTNDTGVLRLSQDPPGDSGQGQTATFSTTAGTTGCPTWSDDAPASPYNSFEIEIDTGDDGMESSSFATLTVFGNGNTDNASVTLSSGTIFPLDSRVETWRMASPTTPIGATDVNDGSGNAFQIAFCPNGTCTGNDEWHVQAVSVIGRSASGTGPDTCVLRWAANEAPGFEAPIVLNASSLTHTFALSDSSCP